jgi:hypothetical protein
LALGFLSQLPAILAINPAERFEIHLNHQLVMNSGPDSTKGKLPLIIDERADHLDKRLIELGRPRFRGLVTQ